MLRIPQAGDQTPPLVHALRSAKEETNPSETKPNGKLRRRKKTQKNQEHGWEHAQDSGTSSRSKEKRQMALMLIGGTTLLLSMVVGVFTVMNRKNNANPSIPLSAPAQPTTAPIIASLDTPILNESEFLAKAEPLAKKLMEARSIEEILPLVRNPETSSVRIKAFYPDGKITAPGMSAFNTSGEVTTQGQIRVVMVSSRDFEDMAIAFFESPDGLKIDWESWVGWSEISWDNFLTTKPSESALFRVTLSAVEYYNFAFSDESKWQSYQLMSPDGTHSIYGYAEKDSLLNAKLKLSPDVKRISVTLALKFPPNDAASNQVAIDKFLADGWVLETEKSK